VWKSFVDRWALVTGASSGIGAEFARQLAARGLHLVLVARRREPMQELAAELHGKHATRCEIISCDLSAAGSAAEVLAAVREKRIEVDLLVNNAGFGIVGEVEQADPARIQELLRLNVASTTELIYGLLPTMLERRFGGIINVSSLSAFQPVAYMGVYAASKAYVLHLSEALACEVADRGVIVQALCPGVTRTEFFEIAGATGWLQKHASLSPEQVVKVSLNKFGRKNWVVVPGWRNRLLTLLVRFGSRRRVVRESTRYFRPRHKKDK
jgi:short-subunit dehydrogenase